MIVTEPVSAYLDGLFPEPDSVLAEMQAHGRRDHIPIVVPATGRLLEVLVRAAGARRALEVGTAIGVSTLHIARGLGSEGTVVSFEIDPERHAAARDYLDRAGLGGRADLRLQDGREGLASLDGLFDFIFLDGVKLEYDDYLSQALPLLAPGGTLAIDNVLQQGAVAEGNGGDQVEAMRALNARLTADQDLLSTVLPVGDGVLVAVRAGKGA
jgi:caffeoyl-CoA O-methyltransferase